jgi:uncharacterized repeat protein (TIGR01451 family)
MTLKLMKTLIVTLFGALILFGPLNPSLRAQQTQDALGVWDNNLQFHLVRGGPPTNAWMPLYCYYPPGLSWSAAVNPDLGDAASLISVQPSSGQLIGFSEFPVQIQAASSSQAKGVYRGTITFTATGTLDYGFYQWNPSAVARVWVEYAANNSASVWSGNSNAWGRGASFSRVDAGTIVTQQVTLVNNGPDHLYHWRATVTNGGAWLSVSPSAGSDLPNWQDAGYIGAETNLTLTANTAGLSPGLYQCNLMITADNLYYGSSTNLVYLEVQQVVVPPTAKARLVALEFVQVIQDWQNRVPLVSNKTTTVRAHLQLAGTDTLPVPVNGARLKLQRGAEQASLPALNPGGNLAVSTTDAQDERADFESSLNFRLPPEWTRGTVTATLEWTNGMLECAEPAEPGGTANDCAVTVSFLPMPALPVTWIYLSWTNRNAAGNIITNKPPANQPAIFAQRLLAMYPIDRLTTNHSSAFWSRANGAPTTTTSGDDNLDLLLTYLNGLRTASGAPAAGGPLWFGMVPNTFVRGQGDLPGYVASGSDAPRQYYLVSHELGHTLGRFHATHSTLGLVTNIVGPVTTIWKHGRCDEWAPNIAPDFPMLPYGGSLAPALGPWSPADDMIFGYDHLQTLVINPEDTFDIMSYCLSWAGTTIPGSTSFSWPSFYSYTNIMNEITSRWGGVPRPGIVHAASISQYLIVRGHLNEARGTFNLLPIYTIPFDVAPAAPTPGPYLIRLLDAGGAMLNQIAFTPEFGNSEFNPVTDDPTLPFEGHFDVPVPAPPGLARLEIWHNGQLLGARNATPNPPVVQITRPASGDQFGPGPIVIQWTASDPDGDPLNYLVQYSRDNGASWDTVVLDHEAKSLTLDHEFLMASPQARFCVIATDGLRSARSVTAGTFTVQNHPPIIEIRTPHEGDLFFANQAIIFEASAYDLEDGFLGGTNVQWQSSLDGLLGTGPMLLREAGSLSEGTHLITLRATDSGGQAAVAQVNVNVSRTVPVSLADLAVSQTSQVTGNGLTFTITVKNRGPSAASGLKVTDELPVGTTVLSATSSLGTCTVANGLLTCAISQLPAGASVVVTLQLGIGASGTYTNVADVKGLELDPSPANNLAVETVPFTAPAPQLRIELAGNSVTISWPATTPSNVVLQASASLSPALWSDVPDAPANVNGRFQVTQSIANQSRYYRLLSR